MLSVGLRGAGAVLLGATMLACGSESSSAAGFGGGGQDSGTMDATTGDDGGGDGNVIGPDATADGPADAAVATGALFVHASADLPDLRFCWAVADADGGVSFSPTDVPFPSGAPAAYSNYPAVPVGGAAPLPDASSMVGGDLTLVGLEANTLAQIYTAGAMSPSCSKLLSGAGQGFPAAATHLFPVLKSGAVVPGSTNVLAVAGCMPGAIDPTASGRRCGATWTSLSGNLHVDVLPLQEVTTAQSGQLPVQAAQLSPALAALLGDAGAAAVSFGTAAGDADTPVATLSAETTVDPAMATALDVGTAPTGYGLRGFAVDVAGFDGGAGHLWMSLEQSLQLVAPMDDPAVYYAHATTYVVAVVGDPAAPHATPDAAYDGTGLHVLVLPLP